MRELFDEAKQELINNLRRNLYDAVNAEYISSTDVKNACTDIKKYLPDDFQANFYEVAVSNNVKRITQYIRKIDVEENYDEIECAVRFLIKSLQVEYLLELNNLVERAYKQRDLQLFEKFATQVSVEAEKVQMGVYETKLPREVFVAYSSKDMTKVSELVEVLEGQGIKCFVAARNLRHGKGSVENYDKALKEAMDHCKSFVFVSSMNSRSLSCDALEIELPYIQSKDTENAPAEFRNSYTAIPHRFKKPRVEYRIEESRGFNAADEITNEFFDGYERVYSPEEVAKRIMKQIVSVPGDHSSMQSAGATASSALKKYCVNCGQENVAETNFCSKCGKTDFVADIGEFIKIKNQKDIIARARKLEEEKNRRATGATAAEPAAKAPEAQKPPVTPPPAAPKASTAPRTTVPPQVKSPYTSTSAGTNKYSSVSSAPKKKSKAGIVVVIVIALVLTIAIAAGLGGCPAVENNYQDTVINGENGGDQNYATETMSPSTDDNYLLKDSYDNIAYELDHSGALRISGSGVMPSFEFGSAPWYGYYSQIQTVEIGDGITSIGQNAFRECYNLQSISIPNSVTRIGGHAFDGCSSLYDVYASGVKLVGESAFVNCTNLGNVDLSDNVESIGPSAFAGTQLMSNFDSWYTDYVYIENCLITVRTNYSGTFEIDYGTVCIADDAFRDCMSISEVVIPDSVRSIGNNAFWCSTIQTLTVPSSVRSIGTNAFSYCDSLLAVTFADGIEIDSIGSYAFAYCDSLASITLPKSGGFEDIGDFMFYDCDALVDVFIPETVKRIEQYAFSECESLKNVVLPVAINFIGEAAFYDCYYLESIMYMGSQSDWDSVRCGNDWCTNAGTSTQNGFCALMYLDGEYVPGVDEDNGTEGLSFILNNEGSGYIVDGYNGSVSDVVIPGKHNGLPVVNILTRAFNNNTFITSISIPASVTMIGDAAFGNCSSLSSVIFANDISLTNIPNSVFYNCDALTTITIPASVTDLGEQAFYSCDNLQSVYFEEGSQLVKINYDCFDDCVRLSEITLPDSVTEVCQSSFSDTAITKLPFGANSSIVTIGDNAFNSCGSLIEIVIPASVENIGSGVFSYCSSVTSAAVPTWCLSMLPYDSLETITVTAGDTIVDYQFEYRNNLKTVVLCDSITSIGYRAFHDSGITNITMNGVTLIGNEAFYDCESLESITLPVGVTSIPEGCFKACTALSEFEIGEQIVSIGNNAFSYCTSLTDISIPGNVETLGTGIFYECDLLENVTFGEDTALTSIPESTFNSCDALKEIVIPKSITEIAVYAFYNCYSLERLTISGDITTYGDYCFTYCQIRYAKVPMSAFSHFNREYLTEIEITGGDKITKQAFEYCSNLEKVVVGEGITAIQASAFADCNKLHTIELPTTLETIADGVFSSCSSLTTITLPENLQGIMPSAFYNCKRLVEIVNLSPAIDDSVFKTTTASEYMPNLLVVHNGESLIQTVDDYEFITVDDVSYLVYYRGDAEEIVLPEDINGNLYTLLDGALNQLNITAITINGTETIPQFMFQNFDTLTTVTIGDSVKTIEPSAFANCDKLMTVVIGDGVESIGENAFMYCYDLVSITLGNNVATIGYQAFVDCDSLEKIVIPENVTTIERYAFTNCDNLVNVSFAVTNGWYLVDYTESEFTGVSSNSMMNASMLKSDFNGYVWKR